MTCSRLLAALPRHCSAVGGLSFLAVGLKLHYKACQEFFYVQVERAGWLEPLSSAYELQFLNAPFQTTTCFDRAIAARFDPPYYQWWNAQKVGCVVAL